MTITLCNNGEVGIRIEKAKGPRCGHVDGVVMLYFKGSASASRPGNRDERNHFCTLPDHRKICYRSMRCTGDADCSFLRRYTAPRQVIL